MTLFEVSQDIADRLTWIFLRDKYFHDDNGAQAYRRPPLNRLDGSGCEIDPSVCRYNEWPCFGVGEIGRTASHRGRR